MKKVPKSFQAIIVTLVAGMLVPKILEITGIALIDKLIIKGGLTLAFSLATLIVGALFSVGFLSGKREGGKARIVIYLALVTIMIASASSIIVVLTEISKVVAYDENNLPKTKSVLAKTKLECEAKLEKLKGSLGFNSIEKCYPSMPFGEWVDYWYRTYCKESLAETTQMTYEERIYKQIIPKIGVTPLNQITTGLLEKFYAHLKADGRLIRREQFGTGLSNAVIRSIHAHC